MEAAVGSDLELAVVERGLAGGHVVVGVLTAEQLKAQVGGGAAHAGDQVIVVRLDPAAEVEGVRVVQAHLGERPGARQQHRMITLVVEHHVRAGGHTPGQVLQPLEQVGFGLDMRCGGDQFFGLGDCGGQRLGEEGSGHALTLERVLIFVNGRTFPRVGAGTHRRGSLTPRLRRALLRQVDQVLPHIRMPIQVIDDVGAAALGLRPGLQLLVQVGMPL